MVGDEKKQHVVLIVGTGCGVAAAAEAIASAQTEVVFSVSGVGMERALENLSMAGFLINDRIINTVKSCAKAWNCHYEEVAQELIKFSLGQSGNPIEEDINCVIKSREIAMMDLHDYPVLRHEEPKKPVIKKQHVPQKYHNKPIHRKMQMNHHRRR